MRKTDVVCGLLPAVLVAIGIAPSVLGEEATSVKEQPDYSKLYLKGDDHAKDSFSLTMQAVARLYGIDVDYETIYALSGNGFAPGIHPPEPCRQLQRMHDRGQCLDLVAARLGLVVRPLEFSKERQPWTVIREALTAAKSSLPAAVGGTFSIRAGESF